MGDPFRAPVREVNVYRTDYFHIGAGRVSEGGEDG